MSKIILTIIMLFALICMTITAQCQDATSAWNARAASYAFSTTYGSMMGSTFSQNYHGSDFKNDFHGILDDVSQVMGTGIPPFSDDDVMNASLLDWPES